MKITQTNVTPNKPGSLAVEFYPSSDDYAYIALRVGHSVKAPTWTAYAYTVFLLLNVIGFPAFLWFTEHFSLGLIVFAIEVATVLFLFPKANSEHYKSYYSRIFGNREKKIATVELADTGVTYSSDGAMAFWPWYRISAVEESDEAVYFFFDGNGFAVRKNGFAYREDAAEFVAFSRAAIASAATEKLPT